MIRPREAVLLAGTKLKTRRIRLGVTVFITSLLFGVLVFLASVTQGIVRSLQSFSEEGYGNRFLVQATPLSYSMGPGMEQEIKDTFGPVQRDLVARKKAAAKKLNVPYDEATDQSLPLQSYKTGPSTTETFPNFASPMIAEYMAKKNAAVPGTGYQDFKAAAGKAGAQQTYGGTQGSMGVMGGIGGNPGRVSVLIDGKEALDGADDESYGPPDVSGVAGIMSLGWRSADAELLRPFVLPGQTLVTGKDSSIPVIAPFSAAEEILGLKALPQTATSEQRLKRLTEVRQGIAGKTAQLCYRNVASAELLSQAAQQQQEIDANKGNKDYKPPALLYQLPETGCAPVGVKSDKRTADEKKDAANLKTFNTEFDPQPGPEQGTLTIRIIGVTPDVRQEFNISPSSVLSSLFTSSLGTGWISPAKAVQDNAVAAKVQGGTVETIDRPRALYYAEFGTLAQMQTFIKDQACDGLMEVQGPDGTKQAIDVSNGGDTTAACIQAGRVLSVGPYGNSAGAVEQFQEGIWKFARYAVLAIVVLAAIVMMGNVGKIIADSRRETAVFRALGARRLDIAQIYLAYTVLLSLLVASLALVLGSLAAIALSNHFSAQLSVDAVLAYNAQNVDKTFSLFGFNGLYVLAVAGLAVLAGLLSALLPLLANTSRNPIRDMRDES